MAPKRCSGLGERLESRNRRWRTRHWVHFLSVHRGSSFSSRSILSSFLCVESFLSSLTIPPYDIFTLLLVSLLSLFIRCDSSSFFLCERYMSRPSYSCPFHVPSPNRFCHSLWSHRSFVVRVVVSLSPSIRLSHRWFITSLNVIRTQCAGRRR